MGVVCVCLKPLVEVFVPTRWLFVVAPATVDLIGLVALLFRPAFLLVIRLLSLRSVVVQYRCLCLRKTLNLLLARLHYLLYNLRFFPLRFLRQNLTRSEIFFGAVCFGSV